MSFIITLYVREGIVMAGDSRMTLNSEQQQGERQVVQFAVGQSDSTYNLYLTSGNVGIALCAPADIQGLPVNAYLDRFVAELADGTPPEVDEVAERLMAYFGQFTPVPGTQFHVAGYETKNGALHQHVWLVNIGRNKMDRLNPAGQQGASWGGEGDVLARLIQPQAAVTLDPHGNLNQPLPNFHIPWQFFTLQDAVDFAQFAVRTTSEVVRFQARPKTVGGPIDLLVIRPEGATWLQRKALHV